MNVGDEGVSVAAKCEGARTGVGQAGVGPGVGVEHGAQDGDGYVWDGGLDGRDDIRLLVWGRGAI